MKVSERVNDLVSYFGGLRRCARALKVDPGYLSRLWTGKKCNTRWCLAANKYQLIEDPQGQWVTFTDHLLLLDRCDDLHAHAARLEQRVVKLEKALLTSCSDQREYLECKPTCDSYGHDDGCEVANPGLAFKRLEQALQIEQAESAMLRLELRAKTAFATRLEQALRPLVETVNAMVTGDVVLVVTECKIDAETEAQEDTLVTQDYVNELWNAVVDALERARQALTRITKVPGI